MEEHQKGDLWQIGPDEQIGEDEGREKDYWEQAGSEQRPEGFVRDEVDEPLEGGLDEGRALCRNGVLHCTLKGYNQLASQILRTGLYRVIIDIESFDD